jgi:hypothetical protein
MHANQATAGSGIWLVLSVTGILAYSDSLFGALRRAYELSARTTSFWEAPSAIQKVGSDPQYLSAEDILSWWRQLEMCGPT